VEQGTLIGDGDDDHRITETFGNDVRTFERIDGDINDWTVRCSDTFTDEEHWCFVKFTFTDDDRSVHVDRVQDFAHRSRCCVIRFIFLTATNPLSRS